MLILAVDTTGPLCSCALFDGERARLMINKTDYSHLEEIAPMVKRLLDEEGVTPSELSAVAVSRGPGSFTGVRIGLATAKALAQIWDKPVIEVPTLESFAWAKCLRSGDIACPMFDARRDQTYAAAYRIDGNGAYTELVREEAAGADEFLAQLKDALEGSAREAEGSAQDGTQVSGSARPERLVFFGDGTAKFHDRITAAFPDAVFAPEEERFQTAENAARLAAVLFAKGDLKDSYTAEPENLREAEAEKKLRNHELGR